MAKKPPLSIGFNVPFNEAIAAAKLRGVVLPDIYYGELQGIARQLAFSIAGVASLDQLQAVKDSLHAAMDKGVSFKDWKKTIAVQSLDLPDHRLDNIWRTNLQGNYMRGKWEQFQRNAEKRPFLMYDAINDSRVRPSHLAMDGTIRRMDDPFWKSHSPPNGYRCVMPWTMVRGDFEIGLKSWYSGKAVEIKTKSGRALTVTANHPILSNNGWVAAQTIKNGSKVLCNDPVFHGLFSGIVDNDYPPISAEQAFKTLSRDAFGFIDIAAFEFHGDTHLRKSKVYVAGRNSILMYGFKSAFFHRVKQRIFKLADHWRPQGVANTSRAGDSSPIGYAVLTKDSFNVWPAALLFIHNLQSAFSKCMSGKNALFSFIVSAFGGYPSGRTLSNDFIPVGANGHPFQFFRIATPTSRGSGISQASCNNATTDVMILGKLKLAFSGLIEPGNQIFINARSWFFRVFRHDRVHFRSGSTFNSVVPEQSIKEAIADPGVFQEFHDRFSSQVFIDEVLSVRDFAFSGHVYDFQCKNEIIVAEDIITHNCRCSLVSLTEAQAQQRSNGNNGINKVPVDKNGLPAMPDKGWHHNPFEDRLHWVDEALAKLDPELQAVGKKMVEQAAELVKKPVFVPATTVKEAEKWMMDNDVVDLCDFGKIKDVDLVNEWNRAMFEHIQEFPELRKNQRFTGSSQAQIRTWYKDQIAKTAEWFRQNYGGISEAESIEKAKKIVKRMKVGNFWAWSWNQKIVQGISINEKWATQPDKLQQNLLSSLFLGFHPNNCETIKSIVDHELGHQLYALLDLSSDKGIIDIRKATQDIKQELSEYAKTNIAEFIAEAWAEYRNNPNPRPVAKQVGDLIRERYAARYAAG